MRPLLSSRFTSIAKPSPALHPPSSQIRAFGSTTSKAAAYGFIGLGNMGYPMAQNLRAKIGSSDKLTIYDMNTEATSRFVSEEGGNSGANVEVASSPRAVADASEAVITVLPESSHVHHVFHSILHPKLPAVKSSDPNITERLFIDCSTIDPSASRDVANAVHSTAQGRFVDAAMSGGVVGARAGSLTFMLGAHSKHGGLIKFRIRPLLEKMGAKVLHLGGQGAGLSAKLANNYLLAVSNIATSEAMNLGMRSGLDGKILAELINGASGQCWSSAVNNPVPGVSAGAPADRDYEGGFSVELMKKDLGLALEEGERVQARIELGKQSMQVYEQLIDTYPGKDFSVAYKWLSEGEREQPTR